MGGDDGGVSKVLPNKAQVYSYSDEASEITKLLPKVAKNDKQLSRESSVYQREKLTNVLYHPCSQNGSQIH